MIPFFLFLQLSCRLIPISPENNTDKNPSMNAMFPLLYGAHIHVKSQTFALPSLSICLWGRSFAFWQCLWCVQFPCLWTSIKSLYFQTKGSPLSPTQLMTFLRISSWSPSTRLLNTRHLAHCPLVDSKLSDCLPCLFSKLAPHKSHSWFVNNSTNGLTKSKHSINITESMTLTAGRHSIINKEDWNKLETT